MNRIPLRCPIQEKTCKLNELSQDMTLTMRQLRQDLKNCPRCPAYDTCKLLRSFNQSVHIAIQEVVEEWGLQSSLRGVLDGD